MKNLLLLSGLLCIPLPLWAQSPAKPANVTCSITTHPKTDADVAFASGKFSDAEELYTRQIAASPSEPAWKGLVHSQIELDKVPDALETAKLANAAYPRSAAMRALTGDAELRAGHIDQASAAYTDARTLDPCSAAAHFGAARLLTLASMHKSAQRELTFAHRLAPSEAAISEALFATLPPAMRAKGLHNLLASDPDLSVEHRSKVEEEVALLDAGATCHPLEANGVQKVDLTPILSNGVRLRDYAVRIEVGESGSTNLELDSTASGIVLSNTDAKKLKVIPAIVGRQSPPYLGYLTSVQIGHLKYERCAVSVIPDATLAKRYSLIGTDFFGGSLIHLDWHAKQMTLTPYKDPQEPTPQPVLADAAVPAGEETWSHIFIDDQRILLPTLVEKKPIGLVMLDTSWTLQMLSPAAAKQFKAPEAETLSVYGVSGDFVRIFRDPNTTHLDRTQLMDADGHYMPIHAAAFQQSLRFGGIQAPAMDLWSFDITRISHAAGIEVSGMVGYCVMKQYFTDIDYRNGLINLRYDLDLRVREDPSGIHIADDSQQVVGSC